VNHFVPNIIRQDGSAFDRLIASRFASTSPSKDIPQKEEQHEQ
jgi:hypothetical protein